MAYSAEFRDEMIQKMASPGGPTATELAEQVGVHQATLSRWFRDGEHQESCRLKGSAVPLEPSCTGLAMVRETLTSPALLCKLDRLDDSYKH